MDDDEMLEDDEEDYADEEEPIYELEVRDLDGVLSVDETSEEVSVSTGAPRHRFRKPAPETNESTHNSIFSQDPNAFSASK